jgi:hypothetical protein
MRWQMAENLNGVKLKEEIKQEVKGGMGKSQRRGHGATGDW